ncbi:DUF2569 domain-containing protein [Novosphingobium sp.]|uniref:DUF2569 domain-containing protein n=1 Tax=Novosphingobium sp. TaxID=1874826 RepID=UPI002B480BB7|nr:DUF2569 domain-containing protein [Novosphingobium sp.]HKR91219.1 DUF2569 domain-containing protein [Novosphingobium sp.]
MGRIIQSGANDYAAGISRRSIGISRTLNRRVAVIATAWAIVFLLGSIPRVIFAPVPVNDAADLAALALPYLLIAAAPLAGLCLAERSFPAGTLTAQPEIRLAFYGKWRRLSVTEARADPAFGPTGFMASLLIGLLLNVVVRSFEFLVAVPPLNGHAPPWGQALFHMMAADVIVMGFFYMVCFVLALRSVPYFPRMLLFAWGLDVVMQLLIAQQVAATAGLPAEVADALQTLLRGNIDKVLISATVWLPYLLLSDRVNITYRQRMRAAV